MMPSGRLGQDDDRSAITLGIAHETDRLRIEVALVVELGHRKAEITETRCGFPPDHRVGLNDQRDRRYRRWERPPHGSPCNSLARFVRTRSARLAPPHAMPLRRQGHFRGMHPDPYDHHEHQMDPVHAPPSLSNRRRIESKDVVRSVRFAPPQPSDRPISGKRPRYRDARRGKTQGAHRHKYCSDRDADWDAVPDLHPLVEAIDAELRLLVAAAAPGAGEQHADRPQ